MELLSLSSGPVALGFLELFAIGVIFLLLVIGCTVDRRFDNEGFKWWVVLGAIGLSVFWFWTPILAVGFGGIWSAVTTLSFWTPALVYFGIGIMYCVPEFMVDVRRAAKFYKSEWGNFKSKKVSVYQYNTNGTIATQPEPKTEDDGTGLLQAAQRLVGKAKPGAQLTTEISVGQLITRARELAADLAAGASDTDESREMIREATRTVREFKTGYRFRNRIVQLDLEGDDKLGVEPRINKVELAEHVSAWTIFWPFYLVALVVGDLLTEVWNVVADFLTTFAGRFVKMTFSDVFSLKN